MEVIGAVFTILGATNITATSIWKLCDSWHDAPVAIYELRDFLAHTRDFWDAVRHGLEAHHGASTQLTRGPIPETPPRTPPPWEEKSAASLLHLLEKGHTILRKLELIIIQVMKGAVPGTPEGEAPNSKSFNARRKLSWVTKSSQVRKLKMALRQNNDMIYGKLLALNVQISADVASAQEVSQRNLVEHLDLQLARSQDELQTGLEASIRASMTRLLVEMEGRGSFSTLTSGAGSFDAFGTGFSSERTLSPVSSSQLDLRLEDSKQYMLASPDKQTTRNKPKLQAVDTTTETFSPHRVVSSCSWTCKCACHSPTTSTSWRLASFNQMLGYMTISYDGFSKHERRCTEASCRDNPGRRWVRLHYSFPRWLTDTVISAMYRSSPPRPEAVIRVSRRVPEDNISISQSIFLSIDKRDLAGVKRFLSREPFAAIDERADSDLCAVNAAIQQGHLDMAELLIRAGADPFHRDRYGTSAIAAAFANTFLDSRYSNCSSGFDGKPGLQMALTRYLEDAGFTDLHKTVMGLLPLRLKDIILSPKIAAQVNIPSPENRWTPLFLAAYRGDLENVTLLLDAGADPNIPSSFGSTALHRAVWSSNLEVIAKLLAAGADANHANSIGTRPLFMAVLHSEPQQPQILSLLMEHGADMHAVNKWGVQLISRAVIEDNYRNVEWLIAHGADIDHADWEGSTALLDCILNDALRSARVLLDHGADYKVTLQSGRGVLHHLAMNGSLEMMGLFSSVGMRGLDLDARDNTGRRARELLEERHDLSEELRGAFEVLMESLEPGLEETNGEAQGADEGDVFFDTVERQDGK